MQLKWPDIINDMYTDMVKDINRIGCAIGEMGHCKSFPIK
jgi:hypothetical protein